MAGDGDEDKEYESDPEDAKMSLKMRRREASDDEDEDKELESVGAGGVEMESGREKLLTSARVETDSDGESDGQGGACDYEELEVDEEEEYYDEEYEEEYEEVAADEGVKAVEREAVEDGKVNLERTPESGELDEEGGPQVGDQIEGEEVKKENEPFAVPTAGAFYMHDDRFRDNVGGRNRRTLGGRKLWESKDDQKWGHDKFDEVNLQDRRHEQGKKPSRGRSRGRGRGRGTGTDQRYVRGNNRSRTSSEIDSQTAPLKVVRGRGPRRYQPSTKDRNEAPTPRNIQSRRSIEKTSHSSSDRIDMSSLNSKEAELVEPKRVASNLNSASPPFYPSGSTNMEVGVTQKRDTNRNFQTSAAKEKFPFQQSNPLMRGKNVVDSNGMEKLSIDDISSVRPSPNMHGQPPFMTTNGSQSSQPRGQGRVVTASGPNSFPASSSQNHYKKVSTTSAQVHAHQNSIQGQASLPVLAPNLGQRPGSVLMGSSPPKSDFSNTVTDSKDLNLTESSKSKSSLAGKGNGTIQGGGRGHFVYGGNQVMGSTGAMGSSHSDPNFAGAPTFLPVMQFGAQHPGGIGVPAVGMAFPGYVGNPQLGLGNSEMTWLPVLAGAAAAGALGASYCPPYIAVDGSYHARPAGAPPVLAASSKDNSTNLINKDRKPEQKPEVTSDELNHRQNKPRRYSEMSFGQ